MSLDLGTLTVKLAADVDQLKQDMAKAAAAVNETNSTLKKLGEVAFGAFKGIGGHANAAKSKLDALSQAAKTIFGDNATAQGQAWGREIRQAIGLSESQMKGLGQAVAGLGAAFQAAGIFAGFLTKPILAAVAAAAGLILAAGALKLAWDQNLGGVRTAIEDFRKTHDLTWRGMARSVFEFAIELQNSILDAVSQSIDGLRRLAKALEEMLPGKYTGISDALASAANDVRSAMIKDVEATAKASVELLSSAGSTVAAAVVEAGKDVYANIKSALQQSFGAFGAQLFEKLKAYIANLKNVIPEAGTTQAEKEKSANAKQRTLEAAASYDRKRNTTDAMLDEQRRELGFAKDKEGKYTVPTEQSAANGASPRSIGGPVDPVKEAQFEMDEGTFDLGEFLESHKTITAEARGAVIQAAQWKQNLAAAGEALLSAVTQSSGAFGKVIQGFMAGGIIGALISLLTASKGFSKIMSMLGNIFQMVADTVGVIVEGLGPIIGMVGNILQTVLAPIGNLLASFGPLFESIGAILALLGPIMKALEPIIQLFGKVVEAVLDVVTFVVDKILFPVIKAIGTAAIWVAMKLGEAWNWIIDALKDVVKFLLGWVDDVFGTNIRKDVDAWASRWKVNTDAMAKSIDDLKNLSLDKAKADAKAAESAWGASEGMDKINESAKELAESLTNLPSGYKTLAAQYAAMNPVEPLIDRVIASPSPVAVDAPPTVDARQVVVNVNGDRDPQKTAITVMDVLNRIGFLRTARPVSMGAMPFAVR
jgi:phage-related protein